MNKIVLFIAVMMIAANIHSADALPRARSVIEIWMWGGPSQLDTFNPKPNAGKDYNNGLKAIPTNVPGISICETLPLLAKQADKYSIIRSMTHGINGHETATYMMQTGREPGSGIVFPSIGAMIARAKIENGLYKGKLPAYISLTKNKGRFSECGFLSPRYKPMATGGNPNGGIFQVEGIVARGMTPERIARRKKLLASLDTLGKALPDNQELKDFDSSGNDAYELISGDAAKAFKLDLEPKNVRDRYGRNTFGQACLAARRLVESGVPYITINAQGWDTHKKHFDAMKRQLAEMDQGISALLQDLSERGLLDTTIVWWSGEFGRTPKIDWSEPWNGGRGHYARCFTSVVAGGGFKGGYVVGESDERAENVVSRPVYPANQLGSICELAGLDPDSPLANPMGLDLKVMPESDKGKGRLKEIYKNVQEINK